MLCVGFIIIWNEMSLELSDILNSHKTRKPVVMGILNVTPDSFSDGNRFFDSAAAADQAKCMIAQGADIIDIGAESTRPGSQRVSPDDQIARLADVLPGVCESGAIVSIDTTLAPVARFALYAGATIVNDVSAGRDDPDLLTLAADRGAPLILMHMLGEPKSMQESPRYDDVVSEVCSFLEARLQVAAAAGVPREKCIVDPGIGFGKLLAHNLALLGGTGQIVELGCPVLIGASRKRFIGEITNQPDADRRVGGTIAACLAAYDRGATIFRVHDVEPVVSALSVAAAIHDARLR